MNFRYRFHKFIFLSLIFLGILNINDKNISIENENKINDINNNKIITKDILFINGCDNITLPHPYRYRIIHQMEQLNAGFLESDEFYYLNFEPIIVTNYRVIILFRCPWTENVDKAIKLAKEFNKKVLFDIDDLVIDTKYTELIPYIQTFSKKKRKNMMIVLCVRDKH